MEFIPTTSGRRALTIVQALLVFAAPSVSHAFLARDEDNSVDTSLIINPNGTVLQWSIDSENYGSWRVPGLSSIVAVSSGGGFHMALRADGTVWTWGQNNAGQLGLGDSSYRATPTLIPGLTDVVAISAGGNHALALKSDGSVWAWGANFSGEVGNGDYTYRILWDAENPWGEPVRSPYPMASGMIGIAAGYSFSLLLKAVWTVWWCGEYSSAQLVYATARFGEGPPIYTSVVQVPGLANVAKIAAGGFCGVALRADSSVWTWGNNSEGELGTGHEHEELIWSDEFNSYARVGKILPPQAVPSLTNVTKIAAGYTSVQVQKSNGTIWAWGSEAGLMNYYSSSVGAYSFGGRNTPVQVAEATQARVLAGSPSAMKLVAGFASPGPSADIRIMESDQWTSGETPPTTPPRLPHGSFSIPLGRYESDKLFRMQMFTGPYLYALNDTNTVYAWGSRYTATPTPLSAPSDLVSLSSGTNSYLAPYGNVTALSIGLLSTGELIKWRPQVSASMPAIAPTTIYGINDVVALGSGHASAPYALKRNGTVWILASSNPTPTQQGNIYSSTTSYVDISSLTDVQQIAAGTQFGLALKKDGTVWGWGSNVSGALGNQSSLFLSVPAQIPGLDNVKSIYAMAGTAYAIKADGSVWAWGTGYPGNGQSMSERKIPLQITQLQGMVSLASTSQNAYAIDGNGRVFSWGSSNSYGTLGLGPVSSAATPTLIPGLENVVEAYIANIVGLFRLENGLIYSCGGNQGVGLLGTGVVNSSISYSPAVTLF